MESFAWKRLNQAQPWEQHWYSTNSDCGDWETLWLLTELIHGLNMADRDAFHQEIQSPDWLYDSKKQTSGSPQKRRWETGWSPFFFNWHYRRKHDNVLHFCTKWNFLTSFICLRGCSSSGWRWIVCSSKFTLWAHCVYHQGQTWTWTACKKCLTWSETKLIFRARQSDTLTHFHN